MNNHLTRRVAVQSILMGAGALTSNLFGGESDRKTGVANNSLFSTMGRQAGCLPRDCKTGMTNNLPITGLANPNLAPFDDLMLKFLQDNHVPGGALAVTRNSQLVYARGFGFADVESRRPVQPDSLFRIASISKPLTAVAVMQLIEKSKFKLNDRLFDVLPAKDWLPAEHDARLRQITVRQLLQHTGGWDRDMSFDPIGRPDDIARVLNKSLPVGPTDVVRYTLTLPLDFDPGTRFGYSNVGYLLLGRLIEHATGCAYEDYVKQCVLAPVGVTRTRLGCAAIGNLAQDEVRYYDSEHREGTAVNGPHIGTTVPLVYGAENFQAFEAHGGWIASAIDLVQFASGLDHPANSPLLNADSINALWTRPEGAAGHVENGKPKDAYYGCGWNVRPIGNTGRATTWHGGLIAGTSTILVRRHDGLNWAVLFNTEANPEGKPLSGLIDSLVHKTADAVSCWPEPCICSGDRPIQRCRSRRTRGR